MTLADLLSSWAIGRGAGEGARLGADRPKAFVGLGDRVLLAHSVQLLDDHPALDGIVLGGARGLGGAGLAAGDDLVAGKVAASVAGGATRAQSVAAGLEAVPDDADLILVHDAARPFVSAELVSRVLEALAQAECAVPGVPLTDTHQRSSCGDGGGDARSLQLGGGADAAGLFALPCCAAPMRRAAAVLAQPPTVPRLVEAAGAAWRWSRATANIKSHPRGPGGGSARC